MLDLINHASLINSDLLMALDPVVMAGACGFDELDPWQRLFLQSTHPRVVANICRQAGKSSMGALLVVHRMLYYDYSLCLLASPTLRQSGEIFKKALRFYHQVGTFIPATSETALTLTLRNGSRLISLPGEPDNLRGFSAPDLVVVDEMARTDSDLMQAITPFFATNPAGRLVVLSTPAGRAGAFWDLWSSESEDWQRFQVTAFEIPRISPAFLERERANMTAEAFAAEYLCEFTATSGCVFRAEDIDAMFDPALETWDWSFLDTEKERIGMSR